jgi:hypothetical protein
MPSRDTLTALRTAISLKLGQRSGVLWNEVRFQRLGAEGASYPGHGPRLEMNPPRRRCRVSGPIGCASLFPGFEAIRSGEPPVILPSTSHLLAGNYRESRIANDSLPRV